MSKAARLKRTPMRTWLSSADFFAQLNWLDGRPLPAVIEPYRARIFTQVLDTFDGPGRLRYNLALCGRAKKNWKSSDLMLAALFACCANDSPGGNQVYVLANDEGQAADDLEIGKALHEANPILQAALKVQDKALKRRDGRGFIQILPAGDVIGAHGKTYRMVLFDEIHGYKNWALFEAMQPDPHRPDAQQWITSYASLYHKPGAPLFDLVQRTKTDLDPRMFFSWYAADHCTDPAYHEATPEQRANPSMATFGADYLTQQARRLPAHQYRRLHLNLPGLPEGSAFTAEAIMGCVVRGVKVRKPVKGVHYFGFIDMSGGSSDDATAGVSHREEGRWILDGVWHQAQPAPFNPRLAVDRFAAIFKSYGISDVWGDNFGGRTFWHDFAAHGLMYYVSAATASQLYEAFSVPLNAGEVVLADDVKLEQQLLGLVWRGGKIDHPTGEHDDFANAAVGALMLAYEAGDQPLGPTPDEEAHHRRQERALERYLGFMPAPPGGFSNLALDDNGVPIDRRYAGTESWLPPLPPEDSYLDVR